ncbi:Nif3-related protein [Giardia muris]|uniref:Nif3-related protein n=1 Tax=Giardia muris TaxID=5742 RepID=A0A4Z1SLJ6_GIAMU|nr:Nif3-related protein [Giardia muris]|eukprot:TNJ26526.1 Nif3-related protein [Giardia muris]
MDRCDLERLLDELYGSRTDWQHNGLQVEGRERISRVVLGVSLCERLIEEAIADKADAIVVHHGFFGKGFLRVTGAMKCRLQPLLGHNINLFAYHLPMDAHPEVGHNALLAKSAGLHPDKYHEVGCYSNNPERLTTAQLVARISTYLDRREVLYDTPILPSTAPSFCSITVCGTTRIWPTGPACLENAVPNRIYICSGGSADMVGEIDADLFIFGEPKESCISIAAERGIGLVGLGHWRSEQPGLWGLQDYLKAKCKDLTVNYVPISCDV